ncbi:MAG: hypothetical protein KDA78_17155 [Planctomycetaceae bacterium]|nr:hypothetical protein [Planctomycetaceae bacterium]
MQTSAPISIHVFEPECWFEAGLKRELPPERFTVSSLNGASPQLGEILQNPACIVCLDLSKDPREGLLILRRVPGGNRCRIVCLLPANSTDGPLLLSAGADCYFPLPLSAHQLANWCLAVSQQMA